MFIDIKNGIVTTSEGNYFRKEDIYKVTLSESEVTSQSFIEVELDLVPEQKVFYKKEHHFGDGVYYWSISPENTELYFANGQYDKLREKLDKDGYEHRYWYTKIATYEIFDKNNNLLGTHIFSKSYEDRMYLLGQWVMCKQGIKELSVSLLTKEKTQI